MEELNFKLNSLKDEKLRKNVVKFLISELDTLEEKNYPQLLDNTQFLENIDKLLLSFLSTAPTINNFKSFLNHRADEDWEEFKSLYVTLNLFGKIRATLKQNDNFDTAIASLILDDVKDVLGERYYVLYNAMKEYHLIYHGDDENKLSKIQNSQEIISNLCALYIAKAKEKQKKKYVNDALMVMAPYFKLKTKNSIVKKKLDQLSKKEEFIRRFINGDLEIKQFIDTIYDIYKNSIDEIEFLAMINGFIYDGISKFSKIINAPKGYNAYTRYQESIKLIKRLNLGNIKIDGPETFNYLDIISYDEESSKYVYTGINFDEDNINRYNEFRRKKEIFENIKRMISKKISDINCDIKCSKFVESKVSESLPFTDEYFEFDLEYALEKLDLPKLNHIMSLFLYDESIICNFYKDVYDVTISNGALWIYLLLSFEHLDEYLNYFNLQYIILFIDYIKYLSSKLNLDLYDFKNLCLASKIAECADDFELSILGVDIISKIFYSKNYTLEEAYITISNAIDLVAHMAKRHKSTVPYVYGAKGDYKYSMYDSLDSSILTCGIDTDACFRLGSTDNDFLRYCALDKNGFVIKITDLDNNFIGRASGFRNGNCVFINQLRTIYDIGGEGYQGCCKEEQIEILEVFKAACLDIIRSSQENKYEENKIEFVFATQSYALEILDSNVPLDVCEKIGDSPMDNKSDDWSSFVMNTWHITEEVISEGKFTTDYGAYPLICMANTRKISVDNLRFYDAPDLYERKRNDITIDVFNKDLEFQLNKMNAIEAFLEAVSDIAINVTSDLELEVEWGYVDLPNDSIILKGDNWYIALNHDKTEIIDYSVSKYDEMAKSEFETTLKLLGLKLPTMIYTDDGNGLKKVKKM